MKVAFIHDHRFIIKDNKVYTTGGLNKEVWQIYLFEKNQLFVFARQSFNKMTSCSLSSTDRVSFCLSRTYKEAYDYFTNRKAIYKELDSFLIKKDCAIIRLPSFLGLIAVDICRKRNIPYAVEVVGNCYDSLSNYGSLLGRLVAPLVHFLNKKAIKFAPYAIYVTKDFLQKSYPCKGISENASDVNISKDVSFSIENRVEKIINLSKDNIVFGQIGHLEVMYKGYEDALKALNYIADRDKNLNITYSIAGSGDSSKLMEISQKYPNVNLKFVGKLSKREILYFLDNIDLYIHPSYQEGLSRTIIEALSRGCPIIASDVGGTSELLPAKYMHSPGDIKCLVKCLDRILNDKKQMIDMARFNYSHSFNYIDTKLFSIRSKFWSDFFNSISK